MQFTREDAVEQTWRIMQPLIDSPPPVIPYQQGTWGPTESNHLLRGFGGWRAPWLHTSSRSDRVRPVPPTT
jgi:glucose-6-phosphate 1-dehydrogenase